MVHCLRNVQEPMDRLDIVDEAIGGLQADMQGRPTLYELYNELKKKAQVDKVRALEMSIVKISEELSLLPTVLAVKHDNDRAHLLIQKNMKNLYELILSVKMDVAGSADPLFTTKAIQCASCFKGVPKMAGSTGKH